MSAREGEAKGRGEPLPGFKVRRARRADYAALSRLIARRSGPSERRRERRFRKLVGDLAQDLYVVEQGADLCGLVLIAYVREIDGSCTAVMRDLRVAKECSGQAWELLLDCAEWRAERRSAARIEVAAAVASVGEGPGADLAGRGYVAAGSLLRREILAS